MILERTAAYVLAVAGVFQTLLPSWTIKPHCWRSIDVQIGRLHMEARNDADTACFDELAAEQEACASTARMLQRSWQEPMRLKVCLSDSHCIMAWDGALLAWMISKDKKGSFHESLMGIYGSGKSTPGD